ncbi:MAG: SDR family NAD(P)-dependent oxidoreductase [Deltaproteobacteria bacterium]|jgi:acyl transferase domain-containing protein/acyl carrier protein|nr:SDR family NAD(P)-dependent oxidoreductase [Deltaproteobacteria bacterium]
MNLIQYTQGIKVENNEPMRPYLDECNTETSVRRRLRKELGQSSLVKVKNKDKGAIVEECVRLVMREDRGAAFSLKRSLRDMGLDSKEFLELGKRLSQRLGVELGPTFFFQYVTPEAIVRYFQGKTSARERDIDDESPTVTPPEQEIQAGYGTDFAEPAAQSGDLVAIIGMSCRFPGGVNSLEEYWSLLRNGVDAITEVPRTRWDIDLYYDSDQQQAGKTVSKYGGFLDRVDQFDARFFRITPREATCMDPQQRILLEETWKAIENAGIDPESLAGSQTGTFVGIFTHDYELLQVKQNQAMDFDAYFGTGNSASVAAGRLAYFFGLTGPTISVDTACSSSLVSFHLACQSLRNCECDLALASGVNLLLSPELSISLSKAGLMAPDGRCKTFDVSADGYVRSEGCGVVVLKRLSQAIADRDNVLAVVRSTAINQDGASNGLTAPNGLSQKAVIRKALSIAGVCPHEVSYVEAHGTGTSLGDPIEAEALEAVYTQGRESDNPLVIGSVKTQIGHTEAAAGIAGLIKVVLSLQHRYIPPHLHFKELNPYMTFDRISSIIPVNGLEWKENASGKHRLAGVSSFGFSGTNAHVVLSDVPAPAPLRVRLERNQHLLTLSAKSEKALLELTQSYIDFLGRQRSESLADVCFTANSGRAHFDRRLAVVTGSFGELSKQLEAFAAGGEPAGLAKEHVTGKKPKIAFLFTGQGSQYPGMGRQLYQTQPNFREALHRCDEILSPYLEDSLLNVLYPKAGKTSPINETSFTQPALFAIEYSLAELWKSWGIEPQVVLGHSVGEYAAACVAGVFSLEDGLKLIAARARLIQALPRDGEMVAVFAPEETVAAAIEPYARSVALAALNGPENIVISGRSQDLRCVVATLEGSGVTTINLNVSHAFHSPLMEPVLAEFEKVASEVTYTPPLTNFISNVTGRLMTGEVATPDYWCHHIRQPVRFAAGMETLHQAGYNVFLEIGPKPTLLNMGRRCVPEEVGEGEWLPSLRPGQEDWQQILPSLARLFVRGLSIDWLGFDKDYPRRKVALPTYPFQRQSFWIKTSETHSVPNLKSTISGQHHSLLGQKLQSALKEILFESWLGPDSPAFLKHHRVYQRVVLPAAAYLEMALAVGTAVLRSEELVIEDVVFGQALVLPDDQIQKVQSILTQDSTGSLFEIHSLVKGDEESEDGSWRLHSSGRIVVQQSDHESPRVDLTLLRAKCAQELPLAAYYQQFREHRGLDYGMSFQAIEQLWGREGEALGRIRVPSALVADVGSYQLHPVVLDAAFQIFMAAFPESAKIEAFLPVSLEGLRFYRRPGLTLWCHGQVRQVEGENQEVLTGDLRMFDETGNLVAQVEGFTFKRASRQSVFRSLQPDLGDWLHEISWQPKVRKPNQEPLTSEKPGSWLIFAETRGIGLRLAQLLKEQDEHCVLVFPGRAYDSTSEEVFHINPSEPQEFQRLFSEIVGNHHPPYRGVVHLWSLEEKIEEEPSLAALQKAQVLCCGSVLHLLQALVQAGWSELPRLWLVTKGARPVGNASAPLQVQQATLWGLARVIDQEHPDFHCVRLDLDPSEPGNEVNTLFEELLFPDREDEVALRQGVRYVARLVRCPRHLRVKPPPFDGHSTYLITGGLGDLGLKVAQWMVQQGVRHLVLTGRHDPSSQAREILSELEHAGAQVLVIKGDVSHLQDVAGLLERAKSTMPPLRGLIHAAGVMDEGALLGQTWERFRRVMAAKVEGAWNLHVLTRGQSLDFFVCFSSVAFLLGSSGQGNYAAANAFMDALMHHRQTLGLPGLSINWGPWAGVGMTARMVDRDQRGMAAIGLGRIAPDLGLQVLGELLGDSAAQIGVFPINWVRFLGQFSAGNRPSLFWQLADQMDQQGKGGHSPAAQLKLLRQLEQATESDRQSLLVTYVQELVAGVIGLSPSQIDIQALLNNMGLDSLMALELRNQIKTNLGLDIAMVTFLTGLSVASLARLLHERLSDIFSSLADGSNGVQPPNGDQLSQTTVFESDWIEGEI